MTIYDLPDLDRLVAEHVTRVRPEVYWEDSYVHFRFESAGEARDALQDPWLLALHPKGQLACATIKRVHEYPPYSTDLATSWTLIAKLSSLPFHLTRDGDLSTATFGDCSSPALTSVSLAICLAALRVKGIEVRLDLEHRSCMPLVMSS